MKLEHLINHHTKREVLIKFLLLLLILSAYFGYLSWHYGFIQGGIVSILTWSFFVLCTPVADAGFLLDFPLRVLFHLRMVVSEIFVWMIAAGVNIFTYLYNPLAYDTTFLTSLFKKILANPYPYWGILILSTIGTFLSVKFGDELMDVIHHRDRDFHHEHHVKYHIIFNLGFFILILIGYYHLIDMLNISAL